MRGNLLFVSQHGNTLQLSLRDERLQLRNSIPEAQHRSSKHGRWSCSATSEHWHTPISAWYEVLPDSFSRYTQVYHTRLSSYCATRRFNGLTKAHSHRF